MLPAQLPDVLKNVAVDPNRKGNEYVIAFFRKAPKNVVQNWSRAEVVATLQVEPNSESKPNEYFEASEVDKVELPDGIEARVQYMEPTKGGGTQGPYWEGKFDASGYTYTFTMLDDPNGKLVRQALSSMVPVPQSKTGGQGSVGSEAELRQAVKDYYEAVDREDWDYTYQNLASPTQRRFSQEEWKRKNQWIADNDKLELNSIGIDVYIPSSDPLAEVKVNRTFKDDSTLSRDTYFLYEDGTWKHLFTQEEINLFMPGTSFEEFVKAQKDSSAGSAPI
jgi:hypothetical protein